MPSLIAAGARDAQSLVTRIYDVKDEIALLDANRYPLIGLLTNAGKDLVRKKGAPIKKAVTDDPEFKVFEDSYLPRVFTGESTVDPDGGNLTLAANGTKLLPGDVILVTSQGWRFQIVSITSDTVVVVGAELGGATGSAATAVGTVLKIGNANQEGADIRAIKRTDPTPSSGYTQIFRNSAGATRTELNTKTYIKLRDHDYQLQKVAIEHMQDIERSFWFSKLAKTNGVAGTSGTIRYTEGVINKIQTNRSANIDTEAEFYSALRAQGFKYGQKEKYAFCGGNFMDMIDSWYRNKLQVFQGDDTYGILLNKLRTGAGVVNLIHNEIFDEVDQYSNYCVMVDMSTMLYRFLEKSDTKLLTNRQGNGEDGQIDEYLTECGLYMENEKNDAIFSKGAL